MSDPDLTLNKFVYLDSNIRDLAMNEYNEKKTGFMAKIPFGIFALKRIDQTIDDPIWEAEKALCGNSDPTGQLPNQPHVEYLTVEFYMDPIQFSGNG